MGCLALTYTGGPSGDPLAGATARCIVYAVGVPWRLSATDTLTICAKADRNFIERCVRT